MVCKNGVASAELHNLVANVLQTVRICKLQMAMAPHCCDRNSVSSRVCWHFCGELLSLFNIHRLIRRLTAFPVKEVNTKIRSTSPCTMTPGEVRSSGASEGKRQRVSCKYKQELFVTYGVAKLVRGVWTYSLWLSFGREQRTSPASSEGDSDGKRRRKPIRNPWSTSDFSRARIEEHYEHSHPRMWGNFKEGMVSADVISAAVVRQLFNMNKLEAHFRRASAGSFKITVSTAVGKLILSLCEKDNDSELATDNDVRLITVL
jgi:hypothetical protein